MADFEKCLKNAEPTQRKMDSNMLQIRNLDIKYQAKENDAKQKMLQLINNWKKMNKEEQQRKYLAVQACFTEAKELCQRKIAIASETYEFVDEFIQKLDNDTAKLNAYMAQKHGGDARLPGTSAASSVELKASSINRKQRRTTALNATSSSIKRGKTSRKQNKASKISVNDDEEQEDSEDESTSNMVAVVNAHGDMPVDPNEPRYCICQQVSFGNMVGCDNKDCPLEWFHFTCVGLTSSPKGKWFCPHCRENKDMKKQHRSTSTGHKMQKRGKSIQDE